MARTIRLAWPPGLSAETEGREIYLAPDQARHGALVLRLKPGFEIEMSGPSGLAPAVVSSVDFNSPHSRKNPALSIRLTGPWRMMELQGPRLALSLIQGPRFDWAVEKSVELGAARLIPLLAERSKSQDSRPGAARQDRWRRLAEEARKQCGRPNPMEILPPHSLSELLRHPGPGFFLSPGQAGSQSLGQLSDYSSPLLAIGPEGGFSDSEHEIFLAAGFKPLNLGATVLRAETAALAALALLLK